jgi:hypothetical protein
MKAALPSILSSVAAVSRILGGAKSFARAGERKRS